MNSLTATEWQASGSPRSLRRLRSNGNAPSRATPPKKMSARGITGSSIDLKTITTPSDSNPILHGLCLQTCGWGRRFAADSRETRDLNSPSAGGGSSTRSQPSCRVEYSSRCLTCVKHRGILQSSAVQLTVSLKALPDAMLLIPNSIACCRLGALALCLRSR